MPLLTEAALANAEDVDVVADQPKSWERRESISLPLPPAVVSSKSERMIKFLVAIEGGPGGGFGSLAGAAGGCVVCELACNCAWSDRFGGDNLGCSGDSPAYMWMPSRKLPMPWGEEGLSVWVSEVGRDGMLIGWAAGCVFSAGESSAGACVAGDVVIN